MKTSPFLLTSLGNKSPTVLAIDPGYNRLGVAVVSKEKSGEKVIYSECLETSKDLLHEVRLQMIAKRIEELIQMHKPNFLATEKLFFSKNRKTALKVAEVRGVVLSEAAKYNLPVYEYRPMEIKIAVTGHGGSDKKQMIAMVPKILRDQKELLQKISSDDEMDAIAIAITHFAHHRG